MFAVLSAARKSLGRVSLLLAALTLSACDGGPIGGGPAVSTSSAVQVALLVPSGSGDAGDTLMAQSIENAARLAVNDLNGVKIDLRVYPTDASPASAAAAATKAADDGAKIILGPVFAQAANAAGLAVAPRGINVLSFSNNADIAGRNVFVLGQTFRNTAARLVSYAASQGKTKIVVVHDQTAAGEAGFKAISAAIAAAGSTLAGDASYEFSQKGVVAAVPGIAQTVRSSGADAIFYTSDSAGALPLVTQLMSENGVDPSVTQYIGLTRWDIPPTTLALPGVQHGWFAMPDPALAQQFAARYSAAYGSQPLPIAGLAYDGIAAIGALVKSGHADALSAGALTQGAGYVGVNGIFRLLPDGTNQRGLAIAQITNKQVTIIDPAPRSFSGAGY